MKALSTFFKALTCAAAVVTLTLFAFQFVKLGDFYSLTGFEIAFGSKQTLNGATVKTYQSAWYWFASILSAATVLFSVLNFKFKKFHLKGAKYACFGFSLATLINVTVLYFAGSIQKYLDVRPIESISNKVIDKQPAFLIAFIVALLAFVLATATMFVANYAEVLESNGAKLTILKRIKNFFKDYKSEITKIVWPSRNTVVKNVIVVIVMCVIVGAYIWLLDFGLAKALGLILGI